MTAPFKLIKGAKSELPGGRKSDGLPVFQDARDVARSLAPERPLLCFAPEMLSVRAKAFLEGFPGEVSYAVKANSHPAVIGTLARAGIAVFDVASVAEMETVQAIAPAARFHYHNPIKSRGEIARAFRSFGCRRFAVDDHLELAKIADTTGLVRDIEIAVRFRLPPLGLSAHDFSCKFGATPEEAALLLRQATDLGFKPVLTFHPGSQCLDPAAYVRHIEVAAAIAREAGVTLHALNVGGGFPARYRDDQVPALEGFFAAIAEAVNASFAETPQLECEPGRGLVAASMSLLTRVKLVKHGRREIFLNDGIYGALLEMSQAPGLTPPYRAIRCGDVLTGEEGGFTVYGPTCDPLDRLPVPLTLPEAVDEDDFVEFGTLGAYGAATSTRFNGYEVADVVTVRSVLAANR